MSATAEFPVLSFTCPKLWAQMEGNEKTRFCDVCQKSVHNLSMMTAEERQVLLAGTGESPCVAYFKYLNGAPIDVTALPDSNPLKKILTQAAMASLGAVALGSIAVNSMMLMEAISKDQEAPTKAMGDYRGMPSVGMSCQPPPGGVPPALPTWEPVNTYPLPKGVHVGMPPSGL